MKVLVVGANGQVGKHIVRLLKEHKKHTAKAMVRKKEQAEALEKDGIDAVVVNLEGSVNEIAAAANDCDALIFSAGSGGNTGDDKTLLIDLDGAGKTIEAAEKEKIDRYIMVSAFQAHNRNNWSEKLRPYYVAKHYADKILEQSSLNYTIVRPGGLLNESGTGKISIAENLKGGYIPREDVAKTIIASLEEEHTFKRSFDLKSGETEIEEALNNF